VDAKVDKGNIRGSNEQDNWIFVSKFCFSTKGLGNLSWTGYSTNTAHLLLLFYDDEDNSWPTVYSRRDSLSCEEKVAMAKANRTIIAGEHRLDSFEDKLRPHYWYVVISNCGSSSRMEFQYEFEFLNVGGEWERQFSFDEQGLIGMYLFFWLFFFVVSVIHIKGVWILISSNNFHPIVRLLTATLTLETFSLLCTFIHYAIYASNGVGTSGLKGLGEILDMSAQLMFMFLLILIAKGWCITRSQISGQKLLLVIVSLFLIGYVSLFTWENVGRDHASSLYIYESIPGILLLVLRAFTMGWFLWELRITYIEEDNSEKRRFYLIFGTIYSIWFFMLIVIVVVAVILSAWDRAKVVIGMYLCMNCLGFCALAYLLWPSRITQFFQISQKGDLLREFPLLLGTSHNTPYDAL